MGLISIGLLYIYLLSISFMLGYIVMPDKGNVIEQICYGFALHIAVFEVIALPCVLLGTSFSVLFGIYIGTVVLTILLFIFLLIRWKVQMNLKDAILSALGGISPILILFLVMVGFQIVAASWLWHTDADDGYYTTISTIACLENRIEITDNGVYNGFGGTAERGSIFCWEFFIAALSKIFRIHPAIIDHTVIIGFLIAISYMAVYIVGKALFVSDSEKKRRDSFLLFYSVLILFSGYSTYALGCRMLLRVWQGKNILACFMLPLFLHSILEVYKGDLSWKRWIINLALIVSGVGMTIIGIYFMPITYFIYGLPLLLWLIFKKKFGELGLVIRRLLISVIPVLIGMALVFFRVSGSGTEGTSSSYSGAVWSEVYKKTVGNGAVSVLFVLSILVIFIEYRMKYGIWKELGEDIDDAEQVSDSYSLQLSSEKIRLLFILIPILMFITFLNPLLSGFVSKNITGVPVYWRLYWIIPVQITIAAAMSLVFDIEKNRWASYLLGAVMIVVIILSGSNICKKDAYFSAHQNFYKIPQQVINATEVILEDSGARSVGSGIPSETYKCAFPSDLSYYVRQYDSHVGIIKAREFQGSNVTIGDSDKTYWWLYDSIYLNDNLDSEDVKWALAELGIKYIYIPGERRTDAEGYEAILVDGCGYVYVIE